MSDVAVDNVSTSMNYFQPPLDGTKPWVVVDVDPKTGERPSNFTQEVRQVDVENVRGRENEYDLDTSGFTFIKSPATFKEFDNEQAVRSQYYQDTIDLVKKVTGANRVVVFDHSMYFFLLSSCF